MHPVSTQQTSVVDASGHSRREEIERFHKLATHSQQVASVQVKTAEGPAVEPSRGALDRDTQHATAVLAVDVNAPCACSLGGRRECGRFGGEDVRDGAEKLHKLARVCGHAQLFCAFVVPANTRRGLAWGSVGVDRGRTQPRGAK
eukprot:CAMPEP_0202081638 /NCGR_PEP_ID=MMETSP0964-20121228/15204_1 /ASSEMBLY_ACC=CAM_ASM_000500 /TAXON_ID=4773 /ORGANISM="Schizochytrium aggregatum, Strain ATCC28209" /LENGTH=144 /DNA_ID=CAMNT_0048649209 /DNA_START=93 /DNA_END=527 /DNA_ORIENTATION=-